MPGFRIPFLALALVVLLVSCREPPGPDPTDSPPAGIAQAVGDTKGPVLFEFWAEWCGPCKQFAPIIDEVAREQPASVTVRRVNIDEEMGLAQTFEVSSIPACVLVQDGEERGRLIGLVSKEKLVSFIESSLK